MGNNQIVKEEQGSAGNFLIRVLRNLESSQFDCSLYLYFKERR